MKKNNAFGLFVKNISENFSKALFLIFYLLLLLEFFATVHNSSSQVLIATIAIPFFLLTLFSSFWGIWVFVASIPLINGFLLMKGFGDVSIAFAGVYFAWLPRHIFKQKNLACSSLAGFFGNLLIVIILLNLCLFIMRIVEGPIPSMFWFDWFTYFPFVEQKDNLWQMNAALILLKGIFLFRMIEVELRDRDSWMIFASTVFVQAVFVIGFSFFQFVQLEIKGVDYLGLYFPFNDVHSFGSYSVLLLVIFFYFFLQNITNRKEMNGRPSNGVTGKNLKSFFRPDGTETTGIFCFWSSKVRVNGLLVCCFLFLCFVSFSRMTWLAMVATLLYMIIFVTRNRKIFIYLAIALIFIFVIGNLAAPKLYQTKNISLSRLGSFFTIKTYGKQKSHLVRLELWERSIEMFKDYPLTGVGIGNFYRNNKVYMKRSVGKWDIENAHNYYLQLLSELGLPGLILFLFLLFSLYLRQISLCTGKAGQLRQELKTAPFLYGVSAYLLTMLTGHPLLLSNQQFLFWAVLAIIVAGQTIVSPVHENPLPGGRLFRTCGLVFFFLFLLGFSINVYKKEPWTIPVGYGLYSQENWEGKTMRWMAGKAEYSLPGTTNHLDLTVVAQPFNSPKPDGLTLTISINDSVVDKVRFIEGGAKNLSYDISSDPDRVIKVNLEVDKVFSPKKIGLNRDPRKLGVAIGFNY